MATFIDDLLDRSVELFGVHRAGLWTVEPAMHPFRLVAHRGLDEGFIRLVSAIERGSRAGGIRAIDARRTIVLDKPMRQGTTASLRRAYREAGIRTVCFVPIVFLDEPLGILALYHHDQHAWSRDDLDIVEGVADQLAVALQNARLYSSVQGFAARLGAIKDLAGQLNRIHDVGEIGRAIVRQIRELYGSETARFYTVDRESGMCEPVAFSGTFLGSDDPDPSVLRVPIGTGLTGWVAEHNAPLRISDTSRERRARVVGSHDPESMLFAPVAYEDRVIGVVVVSTKGVDQYTADDLSTLTIFAGFAGQALANAEAIGRLRAQQAELERRLASQRTLLAVNETLLAAADPAAVFERIAVGLAAVVRYDNLTIYRLDWERGVRVAVLARDRYAEEILADEQPLTVGLTGWAISHGESVVANEAHLDPRAALVPGTPNDPEALVVVPLRAGGEVIGTLNVGRLGSEDSRFDADEVELIALFAGQASIAVQAVEARHAAEMRAERDALTGAPNHGAFQADFTSLLEAAADDETPDTFALLMLDLDGFKVYNDTLGHPAGDRFLVAVAAALAAGVRTSEGDRIYRYGGDEFAALLPGVGRAEARAIADRLEAAVDRLGVAQGPHVTVSVGVAVYPDDGRSRDELAMNADAELYLEKAARRQSRAASDRPRDGAEYAAALDESTYALLARRDPNELLETIVARAAALVGTPHGYLYVVDPVEDVLRLAVGLGMFQVWDDVRMPRGEGVAGRVWETGAPVVVPDYSEWEGRIHPARPVRHDRRGRGCAAHGRPRRRGGHRGRGRHRRARVRRRGRRADRALRPARVRRARERAPPLGGPCRARGARPVRGGAPGGLRAAAPSRRRVVRGHRHPPRRPDPRGEPRVRRPVRPLGERRHGQGRAGPLPGGGAGGDRPAPRGRH